MSLTFVVASTNSKNSKVQKLLGIELIEENIC